MKRLFLVALLALVALGCGAQTIYYESTPTLQWDAVTTDDQGNQFLPGDTVEYEVYAWDMAGGDPTVQPVTSMSFLAVVMGTEYQLSFDYRADWAVAVRTKHTDGGGNIVYSDLAYSTVEGDTASGPFVYTPVLTWVPLAPGNLRDSGM